MSHPRPQLITQAKTLTLHGLWQVHHEGPGGGRTRGEEMMGLLARVWAEVRQHKLANTGINHAVYDCGDIVFAGLEPTSPDAGQTGLVQREFGVAQYVYWKHIGPYSGLADAYRTVEAEIARLGCTGTCPSMEVYGHWTDDASRLETELFVSVQ